LKNVCVSLLRGELRGTESPKEINERYWKAERKWWAVKSRFKDCPFTRGLRLWRSSPNRYMHPVLVEDCAGRGGCCGKGCGCCAKRQYLYEHSRKLAFGHCTFSCLCCEQTRGFKLDKEEREVQERQFAILNDTEISDFSNSRTYSRRIALASFLGLMADSSVNPFHLPNMQPSQKRGFPAKEDHYFHFLCLHVFQFCLILILVGLIGLVADFQ